ncbi:Heavy metal transport/detoxification superfamily protein [Rhynchospora pubera]|uniref:Heavy metal transport/detoxification superfamily protein n=1 Tax=Rhynchospora pubera TaxID=906938 RepID=A0AAV8GBV3_9POAL|nr:Heavy metal transport/detoxification superfamily protein [Rhynchospora pubera]
MGAEKEKKGEGESKKEGGKDGSAPIVLKTDLHCEGCAMKVKKAIKGLEGVEKVSTDRNTNLISVIGAADPWEIKEKLESKIKKKVDLISPAGPKKEKEKGKEKDKEKEKDKGKEKEKDKEKGKEGGKDGKSKDVKGKDKGGEKEKGKDKGEKEKPKEMPESTVVLKIRLHCEGCIDRIRRHILKIKGVKDVAVDSAKDLVTVKGTMDVKSLPFVLKEKLKRSVEVVSGKDKGAGGEEKKDKKEKKDDSKEGKEKTEKSDDQKASQAPVLPYHPMFMGPMGPMGPGGPMGPMGHMPMGPGGPMGYMPMAPMGHMPMPMDASRYDYYAPPPYPSAYRPDMVHAPQMFSDENPNACSIM